MSSIRPHTKSIAELIHPKRRPIVAVVAGSGQIARCAVAGGADLLIVLSAGFFRNIGTGSLASLLPYSNANEVTERLVTEQILPCRGKTPVIAGVLANDPLHPLEEVLPKLRQLGVDGITNWPAVGFIDGVVREVLEAEGLGLDAEVNLLQRAKEYGLLTFGFALEAEAAGRFADVGADALILDLGLTRRLEDVREHCDQLQQAIVRLQALLKAVRETGKRPMLLAFGGPVTTAGDLEQVFRQCEIAGFAGGSVFERLPVQDAVTETVRHFKSVGLHSNGASSDTHLGELIGATREMRQVFELIQRVAPYDVNVCIEGETGTGKELVATLLHQHSQRSHGPFITLNCGAIPETLIESELFGHEKGAFTGAHRQRLGKFELANRGTLFLDEIGDLSQHAQVALLRAIQQREITRVGGEHTIPVDTRIVTASHQSLPRLVREGKFRADLLFRLNHLTIHLPPLRDRKDDLEVLSQAFLFRLKLQLNRKISGLSQSFIEKLKQHSWPGNVRELEHVLRQAAILEDASLLTGRFFLPTQQPSEFINVPHLPAAPARIPKESRHRAAREAVEAAQGNKSYAAASLGVSRKTLYSWLSAS
jgi:DNA-binding NtrC family response regulator/predicted TIM-barrel enzyme